MYCIYKITNKVNGKSYIGQHKYTDESNPMGRYKGSGTLLKMAYKKYGIENFDVEILYRRVINKDTIDALEIFAIEKYSPEYNISKGGTGGDLGEEVRKRQSIAALKKYQRLRENGIKFTSGALGHYKMETTWNAYIYWYCNARDGYMYCFDLGRRQCKSLLNKKCLEHYHNTKSWTITGKLEDAWREWVRRFMNGLYGYKRNCDRQLEKHENTGYTAYHQVLNRKELV